VPLPAAPEEAAEVGARAFARRREASPDCPPQLDGVSVLVVEDEPDSREMLEVVLRHCGAEVVACGTAADALDALARGKPDLILSDIGLPGEDGYELIRKVRAGDGGDIPAVALTAYARVEDRMRALSEGFQMYIAKPVEPGELVRTLEELLGRDGGGDS
jgi:CheY-like chemotaxis protein